MKYFGGIFLITAVLLSSCEGDPTPVEYPEIPAEVNAKSYFPGGIHSTFDYSIDAVDTSTEARTTVANQNAEISDFVIFGDTVFSMTNTVNMFGFGGLNLDYKFRRTDYGIYMLVDSAAIFDLVPLPDSLIPQGAEFQADPELIFFSYPLFAGKSWNAYQANILIGGISYAPFLVLKHFMRDRKT